MIIELIKIGFDSIGALRLVGPAEGTAFAGATVLPPEDVVLAVRDAEQRPDVRERSHGRRAAACRLHFRYLTSML